MQVLFIGLIVVSAAFLSGLLIFLVPFSISLRFHHANETGRLDGSISWMHPWIALGKYNFESQTFSMTFVRRFSFIWGVTEEKTPIAPGPQGAQEKAGFADEKNKGEEIHAAYADSAAPKKKIKPEKTKKGDPSKQPSKEYSEKKEEAPIQKKGWKAALNKFKSNKVLFFMRQGGWRNKIIAWVIKSIGRFFHLFRVGHLKFHIKASLSDPATTGKVYGYWIGAAHALELAKQKRIVLSFDPVFEGECCDIDAWLVIATSLARLALPVILAVVSFPYLSTLLVWRSSMHEKRQEKVSAIS